MFRTTRWVLLFCILTLAATAAASAKTAPASSWHRAVTRTLAHTAALSDYHVGRSKSELRAQIKHSKDVIAFFTTGKGEWMPHRQFRSCGQIQGEGRLRVCRISREALRDHRYLLHIAESRYEALYVLKAPVLASWLVTAFMCIHGGEGAWNANTGNGFYGGLQMDYGFQSTYGSEYLRRWGTADRWPPMVQIEVAIRAYSRGRGFYPWPTTARACGLI